MSKNKGKESENSYQKLKRSLKDRHMKTHGNYIEIFRPTRPSLSIKRENVCEHTTKMASPESANLVAPFIHSLVTPSFSCVHKNSLFWLIKTAVPVKISRYSFRLPILQWSLQFLVGVFTFLSLILWYSYFSTFLSTWSNGHIQLAMSFCSYYYSLQC